MKQNTTSKYLYCYVVLPFITAWYQFLIETGIIKDIKCVRKL